MLTAEEHAPSIVFIDEIDAVGTKRYVPGVASVSPEPTELNLA